LAFQTPGQAANEQHHPGDADGEKGNEHRKQHPLDPAAQQVETGTDATLYGVWGASDDELWAVGGYVFPRTGEPTLVRLTPTGGEVVANLPTEALGQGTFFKVWGTAKDDVWVIGEMGRIVHYDGATWSRVDLGATPRLVTITR
jgi:hypothetical protein